ncbi:SDR family NAD(P)-dependent oxidoreductase, partial [Priestia megaterium]|uniref:SDR family NAD(P)-dependent oxidoreductase n=1 Tax=Priestia megaterium TaxID=1404 RepID=UPI0012D88B03
MEDKILISIEHPVVKNHKAYGQELFPGFSYIDLLYQLFREHGYSYKQLELRNLSIYNPLMVGQDFSILLHIKCEEKKAGYWQIRVEGQKQRKGVLESEHKLYITAEMYQRDDIVFDEVLDVTSIKQNSINTVHLDRFYDQCRRQGLVHTGLMQASGEVYQEDNGASYIEIYLGKEAFDSAESFMFHPTLIDGSGVGTGVLFDLKNEEDKNLFLPLFYETFRASALFGTECITRIETPVQQRNELNYLTMEFFDKDGKKIGELLNYKGKLVRDVGLIKADRKQVVTPTAQPQIETKIAPPTQELTTSFDTAVNKEASSLLQQLIADKLHKTIDQIPTKEGYFEIGLDSSMLLDVVTAIGERLDTQLMPTLLFEYTTIAELSGYLTSTYPNYFKSEQSASTLKQPSKSIIVEENKSAVHSVPNETEITTDSDEGEDIAIIGMSGRYPQARNLKEFWMNLTEGKDCISEVPKSRWKWEHFDDIKSPSGKNMSRWGGFIDDPDYFDPQFFRISPREAEAIDPQERLFLETCWEAIEDSGYTPKTLVNPKGRNKRRNVGVFAGVMHKDYTLIQAEAVKKGESFPLSLSYASIANRVSYFCNFHGPSMAVDTVCSSSLIAVHLALESIKRGECEVALAGGVNLSLHPNKYLTYGMMDMHSSDGYCHTFGKGGDGYVSGEGVGTVLLKPLGKAIKDRDHIYAVIKGSTINHVGTVSGITVPSPIAQADMIQACLEKTGVHPRTISYIEAHGTGTSLGDPIELQGLSKAFRCFTQDKQYCSIGSIKSNIGHGESAAGISGLQKVVLQLYHKKLVPSLHSMDLNPYIDIENSPFYVQQTLEDWNKPTILEDGKHVTYQRRAGLSSFGAYGSNAHVILEEYIPAEMESDRLSTQGQSFIIPLSAKNKERLHEYVVKLLKFLKNHTKEKSEFLIKQAVQTERQQDLEGILDSKIREILAQLLHVRKEDIEADVEWGEYGVEPVHLTQVSEMIQREFKIEIKVLDLFDKDSIASVVAYLKNHHQESLEASVDSYIESVVEDVQANNELNLADLAYTLQVGREAMDKRIAFIVSDIPELIQKLDAFIQGQDSIANSYQGQIKQNKEIISLFTTDEDSQELLYKWITKGKNGKLAELWAKGLDIDWSLLYNQVLPRRIPLPTYPFAKERYWVPMNEDQPFDSHKDLTLVVANKLHPLLHQNTSDFEEQRFSSTFTGQEFFLTDHVVRGQKVLPGVVYLEMARAAVEQTIGTWDVGTVVVEFQTVTWVRPIVVEDDSVQVHVRLFPEESGEITFEIYTVPEDMEDELIVHCEGHIILREASNPSKIDIDSIKKQCSTQVISQEQCYEAFSSMGITYGTGHRGIEKMYVGSDQVLAKLFLPSSILNTAEDFALHPSLMDSTLQASIGFLFNIFGTMQSNPILPFVLQKLEVFNACTSKMWAVLRYNEEDKKNKKVEKIDIDLCNEVGQVCVSMKGFTYRELEEKVSTGEILQSPKSVATDNFPIGNLMMAPIWDVVQAEKVKSFPSLTEEVILVGGTPEQQQAIQLHLPDTHILNLRSADSIETIIDKLKAYDSINHILWIAPEGSNNFNQEELFIQEQNEGVLLAFRMVKALLSMNYGSRELGWSFITIQTQPIHKQDVANPTHASLHGLVGSMAKEYPNWKIRLVDLEKDCTWPTANLLTLPSDRRGRAWIYRDKQWYRQQLISIQPPVPVTADDSLYKQGGVYIVVGGAGRIGEVWSEYMIRSYRAQIIWIGRRQKDLTIQTKLDALAKLGHRPDYISADATDQQSLQQAYEVIKHRYGNINGIIHSAMVLTDYELNKMEESQFQAGLSAKVDVSTRILQVFKDEPLDFILFFSSIISYIKNPRQSHYASGCTFMDVFAQQISLIHSCPVKVINWGYWSNEEIIGSKEGELLAQIGIGFIEPKEAMEALEVLLTRSIQQIGLMKTTKPVAVEGLNPNELITIDTKPKPLQFDVQHLKKYLPDQEAEIAVIQSDEIQQKREMDNLLYRLLRAQLQSSMPNVQTDILSQYHKWLEESIALLERNQHLKYEDDLGALWEEWDARKGQWLENPNKKAQVLLVEATLRALPDILTGKIQATEIMFPNSSMELVEGVYKNNQISDYFNELVADTLVICLQQRIKQDPSARIRILEVGAGTGGTSSMIFKKLRSYQERVVEYCYTDISKAFLLHAKQEYGAENPNLTYKIFNVETPLTEQDIPTGRYDFVVATNVLHATKNIRNTIQNVKALLRNSGILFLNEISSNSLFTHLTFGLLEGWWLYEDHELRIPGNPGLYPHAWQKVLESEGFSRIFYPAPEAHGLGQQIILAESDGIVRQKQSMKSSKVVVKKRIDPVSTLEVPIKQIKSFTQDVIREKSAMYLKKIVSDTLKIPINQIDSADPLQEYGIDSILIVKLTNILREVFKDFNSTLFFEYQTIDELVEYLIKTQMDKLKKLFEVEKKVLVQEVNYSVVDSETTELPINIESLRKKTTNYIKELIGRTLKIPSYKVDSAELLEEYGIDSILIVQLTNNLREHFDNVNSTLFFEYQTIDSLVEYLLNNQKDRLSTLFKDEYQEVLGKDSHQGIPDELPSMHINSRLRKSRDLILKKQDLVEKSYRVHDVAIVGLAGRYPQADDINTFWDNLKNGKNSVEEIPKERWDWQDYFNSEKGKKGTMYTKWGAFIKDIDKFDPLFFQISPAEAEKMDPQERLFLETVYASIEDAGYTPANLSESRKVGVFAGIMNAFYPSGANFWSLSNRISYIFNFQGPSITVDTACSSSLTAIHLALESLYSGTSECAIAGGVNLIMDPAHYLRLSTMTMLSSTNECKAFGDQADGFVDGEGVGAIVLKPLNKAITDGDQIYGIIKASMVNSGGKTNGYTVPNPNAQYSLIKDALQRADVHARTVSYLEAHGTGTSLGDPIEITGLTKAFAQDTQDNQFCAIGSIKSNIGHCESASGIAGVTKVLMQLKHRQIVPSLHSKKLNPNILFDRTPFVVQQELGEWKRPIVEINGETREYPRIAGISSFGAGGSNAHLVIEEYIPEYERTNTMITLEDPVIIVLSAKSKSCLKEKVRRLLITIKEHHYSDSNLIDIAYTLQVGREAMEERLAVVVDSLLNLERKLQEFMDDREDIESLYYGQVKPKKVSSGVFAEDEEWKANVLKWINYRENSKLADLWVKGVAFDWNKLYESTKPHRISLPTYPFVKESYWMSQSNNCNLANSSFINSAMHPLLHHNTSDLTEQRFSSIFTGQEFFFSDHVVQGQRIMPGVAYLEMVRAAVEQGAGSLKENKNNIHLKNVVWARPFTVEEKPMEVHIALFLEENGDIGYEVYSFAQEQDVNPVVHSRGGIALTSYSPSLTLDLKTLLIQCNLRMLNSIEFYGIFQTLGIDYGPAHQGVEQLYIGDGQVLAKLSLPSIVADTQGQFVLHPSLMDSALQ